MRLFFIAFCLLSSSVLYSQDFYSIDKLEDFAQYLEIIDEKVLAYGEYEKLVYIAESEEDRKLYYDKMAILAYKLQRFDLAAKNYLLAGDLDRSILSSLRGNNELLVSQDQISPEMSGSIDFLSYNFDAVIDQSSVLDNTSFSFIVDLAAEGRGFKKKSPLLGGFLSTLFPGLGYGYSHNWTSMFLEVAVTGTFSLVSWELYKNYGLDNPAFVLSFSTTSLFYLGGIYGGYTEAIRYNDQYYDSLSDDYWKRVNESILP
ncbi:hypothetical protein [Spirochaeta cellobiosiphila]|uniref:hypothetical protein n=1 Tax=Spirochaeta cellobiosiphila TaxID=504483 RepID=UPI0004212CFF|nr:hypothetical protein [Spirochaeta cellobiosiphila]